MIRLNKLLNITIRWDSASIIVVYLEQIRRKVMDN